MGKAPVGILDEDDFGALFGDDQSHTTPAGIALADGRQVNVSGVYARDSVRAGVGRAGGASWASSFTFPSHWCEDVAEGDLVQIDEQNHEVKEVRTATGGITTLKLRRVT